MRVGVRGLTDDGTVEAGKESRADGKPNPRSKAIGLRRSINAGTVQYGIVPYCTVLYPPWIEPSRLAPPSWPAHCSGEPIDAPVTLGIATALGGELPARPLHSRRPHALDADRRRLHNCTVDAISFQLGAHDHGTIPQTQDKTHSLTACAGTGGPRSITVISSTRS